MGRYCTVCDNERPNEHFRGRGPGRWICRSCRRMPKAGLEVMLIQLELLGYVRQSKLSTKNQKRLRELGGHTDEGVRRTAALVLELNAVAPGKPRQRWLKLWQRDRALFRRCVEAGFLSWEEDGQ